MSVSSNVVIMTNDELIAYRNEWFQKGVERGRFEEGMDRSREKEAETARPDPVAANASAEQWATDLPDGSVSFDAYAGWSRDQLKDRCLELIGRIEQLEEAANASAEARLREALAWAVSEIELGFARHKDAFPADKEKKKRFDEVKALSAHHPASDCDKQGER